MSFFDKLKSGLQTAKERLTGEHGELTLTLDKEQAGPGETVLAKVQLKANVDLTISRVKIYMLGEETRELAKDLNPEFRASTKGTRRTAELVYPVGGNNKELKVGASEFFRQEFTLPKDFELTYEGPHVSHSYEIVAIVEFAWAVNLEARKPFKVVGSDSEPVAASSEDNNPLCPAKLKLSNTTPTPGDLCSMQLMIKPAEKAKLHKLVVEFKSAEVLKVDIFKRPLPGSSKPPDEYPVEQRSLPEVLWEESTSQALENIPAGEVTKFNLDYIIPETCLPTYHGKDVKHEVTLTAKVLLIDQFNEKKTVRLTQELKVKPDQGDGPAKIFFMWR